MIKAVIFDLDGTLCDTMGDLRTAINAMLTRLGYKTRTRTELIKFINNGARELVRRSLPKDVQRVEFIVDSAIGVYEGEYARCYCDKTKPYDGVRAMLEELRSREYKLAVLSNKQHLFVKNIIESLFGKGVFTFIQGHAEFPTKPDPASALFVAKQLGTKPDRCIFVGDSDVDIKTAQNAGMKSIGCAWGYRGLEVLTEAGADKIASSPEDVVALVEEIDATLEQEKLEARLAKKNKNKPKAE
ncbi:MAG: HAD family hydrolase [Clostridia bacterium]|nr:HAD family hydrolase [Clostridia bacterium]